MATSNGASTASVVRGVDRMIAAIVGVLPVPTARTSGLPCAWQSDRGQNLLTGRVRIAGGFPGSIRAQHVLASTTFTLTDGWFIVGEGTPSGFALPLDRLDGCSVQPCGGVRPPCLVVWYRDGVLTGSFQVTFLGTSRNRFGEFRANALQQQLQQAGIPVIAPEIGSFEPDVHCPWSDIDAFADEQVLYTGTALASAGGTFADTLDTARVWITDRWLLWCPDHGVGMNRLELERILECRSGYGDRLAIGIEDACGGRRDLYFDFGSGGDRSNPAAHVQAVLASAGIPVGPASAPLVPWRRGANQPPLER